MIIFLPVSEAVASVTEAVLAAAVEPAIAAIIKKIMYIKICRGIFFIIGIFQFYTIKNLTDYRKVASSRPVYYPILNSFGQSSQYIRLKFSLHKQSENP